MLKKRLSAEQIVRLLRQVRPLWLSPHHQPVAPGGVGVGVDRVQRIWRREGLKVSQNKGRAVEEEHAIGPT